MPTPGYADTASLLLRLCRTSQGRSPAEALAIPRPSGDAEMCKLQLRLHRTRTDAGYGSGISGYCA
jgi:hypothetical protein